MEVAKRYIMIQFLSRLHLMDYSLLVGIHDCVRAADEAAEAEQDEVAGYTSHHIIVCFYHITYSLKPT